MSEAAKPVPDCVAPGLRVLFVGINPGLRSGETGHHFAGASNLFWRLLHEAGLTPERLTYADDRRLPEYGLGVTNVVDRPTRGADALSWEELAAGGARLRERVLRLRPRVVCLLGKDAYRAYAGLGPAARVEWGVQPRPVVPGTVDYVAPNPSGRSTLPYAERLRHFRAVAALAAGDGGVGGGEDAAAGAAPEAGGAGEPQPHDAAGARGRSARFRLVVSDVEGCVIPGDGRPWPLNLLARLAARVADGEAGRGPRLTLCSGRPAQFVEAVCQALGVRLPAVCENGAVVLYPEGGTVRRLYTPEQARLMERVRRVCLRAYGDAGAVRVPPGRELGVALVPVPGVGPGLVQLREDVEARLRRAGVPLAELFVTVSGGAVDITPRGVDKASGVRALLAELGIAPEEVFAIGDGGNDLPLLRLAGGSGAPANARPEVRAAVDRVASQPHTAGVLELLEGLAWGEAP